MLLEVGQLLDNKYRIVSLLGEGGMAVVFEGQNVRINRRVAIEVLHAAFAGNRDVTRRFEREAQARSFCAKRRDSKTWSRSLISASPSFRLSAVTT